MLFECFDLQTCVLMKSKNNLRKLLGRYIYCYGIVKAKHQKQVVNTTPTLTGRIIPSTSCRAGAAHDNEPPCDVLVKQGGLPVPSFGRAFLLSAFEGWIMFRSDWGATIENIA